MICGCEWCLDFGSSISDGGRGRRGGPARAARLRLQRPLQRASRSWSSTTPPGCRGARSTSPTSSSPSSARAPRRGPDGRADEHHRARELPRRASTGRSGSRARASPRAPTASRPRPEPGSSRTTSDRRAALRTSTNVRAVTGGGREIWPRLLVGLLAALAAVQCGGSRAARGCAARSVVAAPAGGGADRGARLLDPEADARGDARRRWPSTPPGCLRRAPLRTAGPREPRQRAAVDSSADQRRVPGAGPRQGLLHHRRRVRPRRLRLLRDGRGTSNGHTLVWTAGHCVDDAEFGGGFATNWIFVPGYKDGDRPFGSWPARRAVHDQARGPTTPTRARTWAPPGSRATRQGRGIEDVIGARGDRLRPAALGPVRRLRLSRRADRLSPRLRRRAPLRLSLARSPAATAHPAADRRRCRSTAT